jgi:hypothetical protein
VAAVLARFVHCSKRRINPQPPSKKKEIPTMKPRSIAARWPLLRSPWIKYGVIALGLALWTYGLIAQLDSSAQVLTYLAVSLVIAAIALA